MKTQSEDDEWKAFETEMRERATQFGMAQIEQFRSASAGAAREFNRYALAGAAGGFAIMLSRFEDSETIEQGVITLALLAFLGSLYCSYRGTAAAWVENAETAALWAKWNLDASQQISKDIDELRDGNEDVGSRIPNHPYEVRTKQDRWYNWGHSTLFLGITMSATHFLMQIDFRSLIDKVAQAFPS